MQKITFLFGALILIMSVAFTSCSKDNVIESISAEQGEHEISIRAVVCVQMGPLQLTTHFGYEDCIMSYGFCDDILDPIYLPDVLPSGENEVMGVAYANENGELVLHLDGSTLSTDFVQSIINDPFFRVGADITLPEELVTGAYEASGQMPPAGPQVIVAGEHATQFDGNQFVTVCPSGIIVISDEIF